MCRQAPASIRVAQKAHQRRHHHAQLEVVAVRGGKAAAAAAVTGVGALDGRLHARVEPPVGIGEVLPGRTTGLGFGDLCE